MLFYQNVMNGLIYRVEEGDKEMRVALYAIRYAGSWGIKISLDMRVDLNWWQKVTNHDSSCRFVFLAEEIPLGWGMKLKQMDLKVREVDTWNVHQWKRYIIEFLHEELEEEARFQGKTLCLNEQSMWIWKVQDRTVARRDEVELDKRIGNRDENEQWKTAEKVQRLRNNLLKQVGPGRKSGDMERLVWIQELFQEAEILAVSLRGRSLLASEVDAMLAETVPAMDKVWYSAAQLAYLQGQLLFGAGVATCAIPLRGAPWQRRRKVLRCRRCGSVALGRTACATCGSAACAYCEACLAMGRSRACTLLLRGAAQPAVRGTAGGSPTEAMGRWRLSAAQSAAAGAALQFLAKPPTARHMVNLRDSSSAKPDRFLLWAVTGAGKTEMIFPLLASILEAGGRVLVATPRKDVVLELSPRLTKAFPDVRVITLYGGSKERWDPGTLTLATTHQVMRFYQAFDLVIIDEIDAFPFHNDPMLAYAAQNACKPEGKFVYLSATPPRELQREASSGRLPHAKVPVRFHGHPLPVPCRLDMKSVAYCLRQRRIPAKLIHSLEQSIARGAQSFIFVSRIRHIEPLVMLLRQYLPGIRIEGTSSVDVQRANKVLAFRDTEIRLLITTTILERGVTVPRSDVFILDADSSLFDEASLIQMAGRAGRSKNDPAGRVFLASSQWTSSQKVAVSQIRRMNRIAHKGGYLSDGHYEKRNLTKSIKSKN